MHIMPTTEHSSHSHQRSFNNCVQAKIKGCSQFLVTYSKQSIFGLTQERFRELSFSRLQCEIPDRLHIYPQCGITSPGIDTRQKGPTAFCISSERHRNTKLLMLRASFVTPNIKHAMSGDRTQITDMPSGRTNHHIMAPLTLKNVFGYGETYVQYKMFKHKSKMNLGTRPDTQNIVCL